MRRLEAAPRIARFEPDWDWCALRACAVREARRLLRNKDDAEEVAQEALLRAWRNAHACRSPGQPSQWVIQITRNEVRRWAARRSSRAARETGAPHDVAVQDLALEAMLSGLATEQRLRGMSEDDLRLVRLRYLEDRSGADIAAELRISEGAAAVRVHRLSARLRTLMRDESTAPAQPAVAEGTCRN